MTAGPYGFRGSGPHRFRGIASLAFPGLSRPVGATDLSITFLHARKHPIAGRRALGRDDLAIDLLPRHHRPGDPRGFVGQRDRDHQTRPLGQEPLQPGVALGQLRATQHRLGADDQQPAQIAVALPADPPEPLPAAGRVLARHEAEPGGELAPAAKRRRIRDRGGDCRRDQRSDARDRGEAPADGVDLVMRCDLGLERIDAAPGLGELQARRSITRRASSGTPLPASAILASSRVTCHAPWVRSPRTRRDGRAAH